MTTNQLALNIRYYTIDMILNLGFGHLGGALSIVDLLAVLYNEEMNFDVKNPKWKDRDYFILSKGHGGPALYVVLALKGFFPIETLYTLNKPPTIIPSHPDQKLIPGVDATTGSLGQGISIAVGIAHGIKIQNKQQRVYSLVGDGELQEGQCWEAIQNAAHAKLSNLVVFVDDNKLQLDGLVTKICNSFSLTEKFKSFGWNVYEINGHNYDNIKTALKNARLCLDKPTAIIANTIKGKGIPEFENESCPHHVKLDETVKKYLSSAVEHFKKLIKEGESNEL